MSIKYVDEDVHSKNIMMDDGNDHQSHLLAFYNCIRKTVL